MVPGTRIHHRWDGPPLPAPGWCRIHWLTERPGPRGYRTNWLLSAQPAESAHPAQPAESADSW